MNEQMHVFRKLGIAVRKKKSFLALGLDPTEDMQWLIDKCGSLEAGLKWLIDETAPYIVMIKPNLAFYEASVEERKILRSVIDYAREKYGLLICLDVKRGDIMATQTRWAKADIKNFAPDIVTINPYMGEDTVTPYLNEDPNLCVFAIAATSNPKAVEMQDYSGCVVPAYVNTVLQGVNWDNERVGFVVGSTKPEAGKLIRAYELSTYDDYSWFLEPGFGAQGGNLESVSYSGGKAIFPISSGLTKEKYLQGMSPGEAAKEWRDKINKQMADYRIKSLKELLIEGMAKEGLLKIAPSTDKSTWWTLKAGGQSPVYANIRELQSFPELLKWATYLMYLQSKDVEFDMISPVAYGALGIGFQMSLMTNKPAITVRKEKKEGHGIASNFVGRYKKGDKVAITEDVVTSGDSTFENVDILREAGMEINHSFVIVHREEVQQFKFEQRDIEVHYLITLREFVEALKVNNYELAPTGSKEVVDFIAEHLEETTCWAEAG